MPKQKQTKRNADDAAAVPVYTIAHKTGQTRREGRRAPLSDKEMAELPPIPESIRPDLDILFVGINPGAISGQKQLHFGNPHNYFWKGLYESSLIPEHIPPEQGNRLFSEWNMSIVNLVQRTTRSANDLSLREMRESVPELCRKISACVPRIICFVGLGIYKIFAGLGKVEPGLQHETYEYKDRDGLNDPEFKSNLKDESSLARRGLIFVMPSTSGRTSAYQNPEKLAYFKQLKYLRDCVAAGPGPLNIDHAVLASLGPHTRSKYFS
ncbi:uracil DNA N-glycosylase Thp1 [Coemansia sp. RSA 485]|nr:uracil DNA N-glycosylase Thp1 [Coemansia sp. RSA 485]